MRIAYTKDYLMYSGGAEQMFLQTALAAKRHGHDPVAVLRWPAQKGNKYVRALREYGIAVHGAPTVCFVLATGLAEVAVSAATIALAPGYALRKRVPLREALHRVGEEVRSRFVQPVLEEVRDRLFWAALWGLHRQKRIELVHAHETDSAMPAAVRWAVRRGAPVVCHDHCGPKAPSELRERLGGL